MIVRIKETCDTLFYLVVDECLMIYFQVLMKYGPCLAEMLFLMCFVLQRDDECDSHVVSLSPYLIVDSSRAMKFYFRMYHPLSSAVQFESQIDSAILVADSNSLLNQV